MPKPMVDLTGQRFGRLVVLSQAFDSWEENPPVRRRNWNVLCDCGTRRVTGGKNMMAGKIKSCGCLWREAQAKQRMPEPTYSCIHQRLYRDRGPAKEFDCVDCGDRAVEWSYDHLDPDEKTTVYYGTKVRYSTKQEHYEPRCRFCHRSFDGVKEAREKVGA